MLDFLRNLTKSNEEKRQETITAYLDNALTPRERTAFEQQLQSDPALRADLERQRLVKLNLSQLPRQRAPRNFTLDPAAFGRPAPQPAFRLYPMMRAATALAAIMLIFLFSLDLISPAGLSNETAADAPVASSEIAREETAGNAAEEAAGQEAAPAPATELLEPVTADEGEAEVMMEEPAQEEVVEEEMAEEEAPAEGAIMEAPPTEPMPAAEGEVAAGEPEAAATEQTRTITEEAYPGAVAGDGVAFNQTLTPTPTLDVAPTITPAADEDVQLFSTTQAVPTTTYGLDETAEQPSLRPIQLLQISLGILFLVFLAATLLLRRRL
jgi:hypothetical protein